MIVHQVEQGSPEWRLARLGIPTASNFQDVLAPLKGEESIGRRTYMRKLAGEVLTREPMSEYRNPHFDRGHERESEALRLYSFVREPVTPVGFVERDDHLAGCSPDGFVGSRGMVESKDALAHVQIERLQKNVLPPEHEAQVRGNLWIAERDWCDFISYSRGLPPLIVRVERDAGYEGQLERAVWRFHDELDALVAWLRSL